MSRLSPYLNHTHAGVQEDGSFGLFGDLLIFVEVQVIGAVPELGQVEISPLKGLGQKCRYGIWKEKSIKTFPFHFFPSPPDKCIYHPLFWNINTLEVKGFKFWCQQFLIASVIHPTSVSPSWWRWWHCSCCLCIASRAWRRHLSGIPARPYPADGRKADRTLLTALTGTAHAQRGEHVSVSLYQQRENITVFFNASLQNVQGDLTPPPRSRLSAQEIFDAAAWDETELN